MTLLESLNNTITAISTVDALSNIAKPSANHLLASTRLAEKNSGQGVHCTALNEESVENNQLNVFFSPLAVFLFALNRSRVI